MVLDLLMRSCILTLLPLYYLREGSWMNRVCLASLAVILGLGSLAFGDSVSLSGANVSLGLTHTFVLDTANIIASGFYASGTPGDLWGKSKGTDEIGLGLQNDKSGDHE